LPSKKNKFDILIDYGIKGPSLPVGRQGFKYLIYPRILESCDPGILLD